MNKGQFARLRAFVPVRADTVVAWNAVWACDNISQTAKHWKQTDEATCCINLVILTNSFGMSIHVQSFVKQLPYK